MEDAYRHAVPQRAATFLLQGEDEDACSAATVAFAARVAFIHSVSHGVRIEDVIRQSATKVPLAPASIQSVSTDRSDSDRMTADFAPSARATR